MKFKHKMFLMERKFVSIILLAHSLISTSGHLMYESCYNLNDEGLEFQISCIQWTQMNWKLHGLEGKVERMFGSLNSHQLTDSSKRIPPQWFEILSPESRTLGAVLWSPENQTLYETLKRHPGPHHTPHNVSRLILGNRSEKETLDMTTLEHGCRRLGLESPMTLSNLSTVTILRWGYYANVLKCLSIFSPNLHTLVFATLYRYSIQNVSVELEKLITNFTVFPQVKTVELQTCQFGGHRNSSVSLLSKVLATFPSLKSLAIDCSKGPGVPGMHVLQTLHKALKHNPQVRVSQFTFYGDSFRAGRGQNREKDYGHFCKGRRVAGLNFFLANRPEELGRLLQACTPHLRELQITMDNLNGLSFTNKSTTVRIPPMKRLRRLRISLYDEVTCHPVKYSILGSGTTQNPFPSLEHLVLNLPCWESSIFSNPEGALFDNEDFLSMLSNLKVLTITPQGMIPSDPLYRNVMKKFAIWYPRLSVPSLNLIRGGVEAEDLMRDEFAPPLRVWPWYTTWYLSVIDANQ